MSKTKILCGGSALAVAASLCASGAFAATATASASSESTGAATVGELVVVAEKREQNIETVPVAVTAFSAEQRVLMNIVKVQDLSDFAPGLSWTDVDDRLYIRGIGRNSDNLNNTSGVAIYYNGVYYGANANIELQKDDLFIGNIEVDNGPQNTLHGSNADGGLIQYTSQRPTNTPYEEVRAEIDNYSEYRTEFAISGPLDDHWKFRIGGNYSQMTGGFFNNLDGAPQGGNLVLGGGGQTHYIEGQIEGNWDKFDLWGMISSGDFAANTKGDAVLGDVPFSEFNGADTLTPSDWYGLCGLPGVASVTNGCWSSPGVPSGGTIVPGSVVTAPYNGSMFPGGNAGNLNPRDFLDTMNTLNDQQDNLQLTLHLTWHADDFDVEYLGGYQQMHYVLNIADQFIGEINAGVDSWEEQGPPGLGNLLINPSQNYLVFNEFDQSFSHEIDITSTWKNNFNYIAGLYWYHERWNQPVEQGAEPSVDQPENEFTTGAGQPQMGAPEYWTALGDSCPNGGTALGLTTLCAAPPNPSYAYSSENTAITYDSLAAFAKGSYKFNDQWKVSGAVRYTSDHKEGIQTWRVISFDGILTSSELGAYTPALDITNLAAAPSLGVAFPGAGPATLNPTFGWAQRKLDATWGALTGEADVDWTPDPSLLAYFKYSRGYKSGGWSTYTLGPLPEVGPEFVDAFELGVKKTVSSTLVANGD
ncbi:MAG TPA: TonB-dependent receptor, partial [Caulobacteraceae bacterium]|nr:TonB-dependent receptor [Caulobacteraceae bacterium]